MKNNVNVIGDVPPENLRRLAAATVIQAVKEMKEKDPLKSVDAVLWLTGQEGELFLNAAGMEKDPMQLLTSGNIRRRKTKRNGNG